MATVFDVVSGVNIRLGAANIPSTLSDGSTADLATDRINFINQLLGLDLNSGNFSASYLQPLRDLVTADVIAIRNNTDIDTQISVGNISLNYRDKQVANQWQAEYWIRKAEDSLNQFSNEIVSDYTTKAD